VQKHAPLVLLASTLVLAPLAACSSTLASSGPLYRSNVVSYAQLQQTTRTTLFDALRGIHPEYFIPRGRISINNIPGTSLLVYSKGMLMGETDVLSWIPVSEVAAVRRLSAVETFHKYGRTTAAGALEIDFRDP